MDFDSVNVKRLRVSENIVVSHGGDIPNINNTHVPSESGQLSVSQQDLQAEVALFLVRHVWLIVLLSMNYIDVFCIKDQYRRG